MPLTPAPNFLAPWDLVDEGILVSEPPDGLRSDSVRLGSWRSPDTFPWDVSLVRTQWHAPPEAADHGRTVFRDAPSLLLVPRPWAAPQTSLLDPFTKWRARLKRGPSDPDWVETPGAIRWRHFLKPPFRLDGVWETTLESLEGMPAAPPTRKGRQGFFKRWWDHTPWLFALSQPLLRGVRAELQIPRTLGNPEVLAAGRGARAAGWLSGNVPRRKIPANWLRVGAYEALRAEVPDNVQFKSVAAFIDRIADGEVELSNSTISRDASDLARERQDRLVVPTLVPLTWDPVSDDEPDFESWATRWLADGRAVRDLWLVFGKAVRYFRWGRVAGTEDAVKKARTGLRIFDLDRIIEFEPTVENDPVGRRLRWVVGEVPDLVVAPAVPPPEEQPPSPPADRTVSD